MGIVHLQGARRNRNDEFYTQLPDIEKEVQHYLMQLQGKTIFCNCDNPSKSNFWKYFFDNFHALKLNRLISTYYNESESPYKCEYDGRILIKEKLKQDGDFRTPEVEGILERADVVVTNPPFSLFIDYVNQLEKYGKKYLLIGNTNAITYKEVFELFRLNKIRIGCTNFNVGMFFAVPDHFETFTTMKDGVKYARVSTSCWFTNLDTGKPCNPLRLQKSFHPNQYPTYENYQAIEVGKVENIPNDYDGVMGVPITFLHKHSPHQFEIIGADFEVKRRLSYLQNPTWKGSFHRGVIDGKTKYARVLIKAVHSHSAPFRQCSSLNSICSPS